MSALPRQPSTVPTGRGIDAPEISVIMPNYNGARLIGLSVESVLVQSFRSIELLVIDDGSGDDSIRVVEAIRDPRIRLIRQTHQGVCAARNRGIREAKGTYIAFLDSDDTWSATCLERLHNALTRAPNAALAYCGWQNVGLRRGRCERFVPPDYETPDKLELWLRNSRWPIHAALSRKDAIVAAGGFDPRFPTSEDFLLWLRIVAEHEIVRVPEVLAFYYHHDGSRATSNRVPMALNHLDAQLEYLRQRPSVVRTLGRRKIRDLTLGELLAKGNECYWQGDLECARRIFKRVMQSGYGSATDWKRMLPALLPIGMHRQILHKLTPPGDAGASIAADRAPGTGDPRAQDVVPTDEPPRVD